MKATEILTEKWSQKYKSSINCSHPKGFSQKAHCAGKKKHNESIEMEMVCEDCGMCQTHGSLNEIAKGAKDSNGVTKCWPGYHAAGTKKGRNGGQVRNCVPNESIGEAAPHPQELEMDAKVRSMQIQNRADDAEQRLAARAAQPKNIVQKIKKDIGGPIAKLAKGDIKGALGENDQFNPEYDDEAGMADNNLETLERAVDGIDDLISTGDNLPEWCQEKIAVAKSMLVTVWDYMKSEEGNEDPDMVEMYEAMELFAEEVAANTQTSVDAVWEQFEAMDDHALFETAAWRRSAGKSKKGGLNAKGVASYRRENPGSKLQMAVTTKPSKLKPGSKAAKRRKSFCARMGGVKGPMKKPNGKPTRKALALRKWNC